MLLKKSTQDICPNFYNFSCSSVEILHGTKYWSFKWETCCFGCHKFCMWDSSYFTCMYRYTMLYSIWSNCSLSDLCSDYLVLDFRAVSQLWSFAIQLCAECGSIQNQSVQWLCFCRRLLHYFCEYIAQT